MEVRAGRIAEAPAMGATVRGDAPFEEGLDQGEEQQGRFFQQFNRRLLVGIAVVVLAVAYLLFIALQEKTSLYLTVDELRVPGADVQDRRLRVGGRVVAGSIERSGDGLDVQFMIADQGAEVPVAYRGAVPDIFQGDLVVFVEGVYTPEGLFHADVLLVRHPDTMEPLESMAPPSSS